MKYLPDFKFTPFEDGNYFLKSNMNSCSRVYQVVCAE